MKILRVELESGIGRKLFEIPLDEIEQDDLKFFRNSVSCDISIEKSSNGYHLKGSLDIPFIETCDRCLREFTLESSSNFDIILSENEEIAEDIRNYDVIYFPPGSDHVDLTEVLHDIINLEDPIKKVCKEDCKGLCANCGNDLNVDPCDCHQENTNPIWDKLKELK